MDDGGTRLREAPRAVARLAVKLVLPRAPDAFFWTPLLLRRARTAAPRRPHVPQRQCPTRKRATAQRSTALRSAPGRRSPAAPRLADDAEAEVHAALPTIWCTCGVRRLQIDRHVVARPLHAAIACSAGTATIKKRAMCSGPARRSALSRPEAPGSGAARWRRSSRAFWVQRQPPGAATDDEHVTVVLVASLPEGAEPAPPPKKYYYFL